jgi:hypothetical protein
LDIACSGRHASLPSLVSEQFPVETRAIGVSLGFSTAVSIFGGHALLVATWLTSPRRQSYYLIFTALLSLFALMAIQWRSRRATQALAHPAQLAGGRPAQISTLDRRTASIPVTQMASIAP